MKHQQHRSIFTGRQQKLTLFGLMGLRRNKMEHILDNYYSNTTKKHIHKQPSSTDKPLITQSKNHYSKQLKFPIRLQDDPQWPEQKKHKNRLKLYLNHQLPIDYFQFNRTLSKRVQQIFSPSQPHIPLTPQLHPQLFSNFNEKSFRQAPIEQFYPQSLQHKFEVNKQRRCQTQPNETSINEQPNTTPRESLPLREIYRNNAKSFSKKRVQLLPVDFFKRNRSLTSAICHQLQFLDENRQRKGSKQSKTSGRTGNSLKSPKRLTCTYSVPPEEITMVKCQYSDIVSHFLQLAEIQSEQLVTNEIFFSFIKSKYGKDITSLPIVTAGATEHVNLALTAIRMSKMSLEKVHRICFKYYDHNQNDLIEQADIFAMIQKSQRDSFIDGDLSKISHYLNRGNYSVLEDSGKIQTVSKIALTNTRLTTLPSITDKSSSCQPSHRFKLRLFSLVNQHNQQGKKSTQRLSPMDQNWNISIPFLRFKQIFRGQRPQLFYKLMYEIFGVQYQGVNYNESRSRQMNTDPENKQIIIIDECRKVESVMGRVKSFRKQCFDRSVQKFRPPYRPV